MENLLPNINTIINTKGYINTLINILNQKNKEHIIIAILKDNFPNNTNDLYNYDLYLIKNNYIINQNDIIGSFDGYDVYLCDINFINVNFNLFKTLVYLKKFSKEINNNKILEKSLGFTPDLIGKKKAELIDIYKNRYHNFVNNLPNKSEDVLRIMTYNVNQYAFSAQNDVIRRINAINPDIILLNEVMTNDKPISLFPNYKYSTKCDANGNSGNIILSKLDITNQSETQLIGHNSRFKCYIKIFIETYNLLIYGTHLDAHDSTGNTGNTQLKTIIDDTKQYYDNKNIIIMGDFNKKYKGDIYDVLQKYSIENNTQIKPYNEDFYNIIKDINENKYIYKDVFELTKINAGLSHWSHRHIDYMFVNNKFIDTFGEKNIIPYVHYSIESDHMPIIIDLIINNINLFKQSEKGLFIEFTSKMGKLQPNQNQSSHKLYTADDWWIKCGLSTSDTNCSGISGQKKSYNLIISECLTSSLYQLFNIPVNKSYLIIDDAKQIVNIGNSILIGTKTVKFGKQNKKLLIQNSKEGIFIDCLLINWDVHKNDNTVLNDKNEAVRLDVGGALLYRAQGELKSGNFETPIEHYAIYGRFIKNQSEFGNIFHEMSTIELKSAYGKLMNITTNDIKKLETEYLNGLDKLKNTINNDELDEMKNTVKASCALVINRLNHYQNNEKEELTKIITLKNNYNFLKSQVLNKNYDNLFAFTVNAQKNYSLQRYTFFDNNDLAINCSGENLLNMKRNIFTKYTKHVKLTDSPVAIILFGSPASGKTYCTKQLFNDNNMETYGIPKNVNNYVYIDLDEIRLESTKYRNMINGNTFTDTQQPWIWASTNGNMQDENYYVEYGRGELKHDNGEQTVIFKSIKNVMSKFNCRQLSQSLVWNAPDTLLKKCSDEKYNIIYDASCADWIHCKTDIIEHLSQKGYKILIVGVGINNLNDVVENSKNRQIKDGRFMDDTYVKTTWNQVRANIKDIKEYAKIKKIGLIIIDNTDKNCKIDTKLNI